VWLLIVGEGFGLGVWYRLEFGLGVWSRHGFGIDKGLVWTWIWYRQLFRIDWSLV